MDIYSTNLTRGRLAFKYATTMETADVIAGTEVGFRVNQGLPDEDAKYVSCYVLSEHHVTRNAKNY